MEQWRKAIVGRLGFYYSTKMTEPVELFDAPDAHPERLPDAPPMLPANVSTMTLKARVALLEDRVDKIILTQTATMPAFRAALERILTMRNTLHAHGNSLQRLEALAQKSVASQELAAANVAELVALIKHAKTWGGLVRKHGPRVFAFVVGALVMGGKISAETGASFLHLFGL